MNEQTAREFAQNSLAIIRSTTELVSRGPLQQDQMCAAIMGVMCGCYLDDSLPELFQLVLDFGAMRLAEDHKLVALIPTAPPPASEPDHGQPSGGAVQGASDPTFQRAA